VATTMRREEELAFGPRLPAPDDVRVVDCARCGQVMHGERQRAEMAADGVKSWVGFPPPVGGRYLGRPYCKYCLGLVTPGPGIGE